jgi:hypothetical protein
VTIGLTACSVTEGEINTLVGGWLVTVPGAYEANFRFEADGAFVGVDAAFDFDECSTSTGTWRTEADLLSLTITELDGDPVSETADVPFDLSDNTLTLNWVDDEREIFTRSDDVLDCASYVWPPPPAI